MAIKLTKNELKKQKENLKQFERYLPTLQLKKQQLQSVIMKIRTELEEKEDEDGTVLSGYVSAPTEFSIERVEGKLFLGNPLTDG